MDAFGITDSVENPTPQQEFRELYKKALRGEELSNAAKDQLSKLFGQAQIERWNIDDVTRWTKRKEHFPDWDFTLERFPDVYPLDEESDYFQMNKRFYDPDGDELLPNETKRWIFYNQLLQDTPTKIPEFVPSEWDSLHGERNKEFYDRINAEPAWRTPPPELQWLFDAYDRLPPGIDWIPPNIKDYLDSHVTWEERV